MARARRFLVSEVEDEDAYTVTSASMPIGKGARNIQTYHDGGEVGWSTSSLADADAQSQLTSWGRETKELR